MAGEFATDFDGAADYLSRGSDLVGNADGKTGILSFWFRADGNDGVEQFFMRTQGSRLQITKVSGNSLRIQAFDAAGPTRILQMFSSTQYTASATWHHFLASWDLGATTGKLYVDDVDRTATDSFTDAEIEYTRSAWGLGATDTGGSPWNGGLSEFYLNTAEYLDFSVTANRRKFISAAAKPVPLGPTGNLPTGTAAIIYAPDGNPVVNQGTGGNFTENGAPVRIAGPGDKPSPAAKIYEVLRGS